MSKSRCVAVVAALALAAAACGGPDTATETTSAGAVTAGPAEDATTSAPVDTTASTGGEAATTAPTASGEAGDLREILGATAEATTGRMEGEFVMVGVEGVPDGGPITLSFTGEFDNEAGLFAFRMDMSEALGGMGDEIPPEMLELFGDLTMEVREIGETTYMRFPLFSFLGVTTEWVSMPTDEGVADDLAGAAPSNPTDFLDAFGDADAEAEELGTETVRGVETNHFRVVIDTESLLEDATPEQLEQLEAQGPLPQGELPVEVWVGDDGLIHRYVVTYDGSSVETAPGEGFEEMTITIEMYDYGTDIGVEAPPPDQVTDSAELGGLFDGLGG